MIEFGAKFSEYTGNFPAPNQDVVGPFDLGLQIGMRSNRPHQSRSGSNGKLRCGLGPKIRTKKDGEPQTLARRGNPFAPKTSAAPGLRFGEYNGALANAISRKSIGHIICRLRFFKHANVAANDLARKHQREQIIRVQEVRDIAQAIPVMWACFNLVTKRAQLFNARPYRRPGDAEGLRKLSTRSRAGTRVAEGGKDLRIDCHAGSKSSPISAAGAEWVRAPTEMKSTPLSAIARTVARVTPPLASVLQRPFTSLTAFRSWSGVMLSRRMMSAPAFAACAACSRVSASTSTFREGYFSRARATASATFPPRASMWLFLMRTMSKSPNR